MSRKVAKNEVPLATWSNTHSVAENESGEKKAGERWLAEG